jgi:dTDP-glucose 4,6-dehydratase
VKNVLISGGAGFIGSNFVRFLLEKEPDFQVINLDLLTYAGSLENLQGLPNPAHHTFVEGNICDGQLIENLLRKHSVDTIVHFAAESHVDRSILGPALFIETNIIGTFKLLEAARKVWEENGTFDPDQVRFHHISTDEVYGSLEPGEPAFTENTPYAPNSPYAASKAASDHLVRAHHHTYQLPITVTNCSNNYGPYQFPEKLIPLMIMNALRGKSLPIYGDGKQIRDWLYVQDHCEAIWQVLKAGRVGETYNIGGGNQPTNLEVVQLLCKILDEEMPDSSYRPHSNLITFVKDRPGHDRRYAMDSTKLNVELGWKPVEDLESGLRKTVKWYLTHEEWTYAVLNAPSYQDWLKRNYINREEKL